MSLTLTTPVRSLGRVGAQVANRLAKLEIETVQDLIFYYPYRWQDFSKIVPIELAVPGDVVTIKGKLELITNRRSPVKRRIITEALVSDDSASIKVIWFNQPFLTKTLKPGDEVYLSGKIIADRYSVEMISPIYELARGEDTMHTARIVPMYSLTESLSQKQLRFLIKQALPSIEDVGDTVPSMVRDARELLGLHEALRQIHFPDNKEKLDLAIGRLKFDELFFFQLASQLNRAELQHQQAQSVTFHEAETKQLVSGLPFTLTPDQKKAAWQIISELGRNKPMNRLLEGEVGSGKTVVATIALFNVAIDEQQGALMAPTEILAEQHYQKVYPLLSPFNINVALLTRTKYSINGETTTKSALLKRIRGGGAHIVIGTHALIQDRVSFKNLVLAIIDEQHRFGVAQRQALRVTTEKNGIMPHLLSMTATPIPRSLALTLYGDLDVSIIRQLPKERKKIITQIVDPADRKNVYAFVKKQVDEGRQIFVICPLIDPSDRLGVRSVIDEVRRLRAEVFPNLRIEMLHGKMKPQAKNEVMSDFVGHKSDILVSTSVVEVGVDVPNASVMIIEGAERFGLSQLHQFRGRVGRAHHQSYCFLLTESQLDNVAAPAFMTGQSEKQSVGGADSIHFESAPIPRSLEWGRIHKTKERLGALMTARDGFELAEMDLTFRGPGEVYGTAQSGFPEFRLAALTDREILLSAHEAASELLTKDPGLSEHPALLEKISDSLGEVHLE